MSQKKADKESRLTTAAATLFHQRGYEGVTLREIAAEADVPPGAVFYHFPTKRQLAKAVIDSRHSEIETMLACVAAASDSPRARLSALLKQLGSVAEATAKAGCPVARLCADLVGESPSFRSDAASVFYAIERFASAEFVRTGKKKRDAERAARHLVTRWQGASALAMAFNDKSVLLKELQALDDWLADP